MKTVEARAERQPKASSAPFLGRLILRNYRNFERLECEFPETGVAIVGPNGSGKTNLLEAIYYLEVFRSFRGVRDGELVRFGKAVFRVEGTIEGVGSVAAAYDRSQRIKKVEVDEREVDRVSEGIGSIGAAVFRLEDAEIVRGGPATRRRFLDMALSVGDPRYLAALQRYRALLAQRNEALRRGAGGDVVGAWTDGLIETGALVSQRRAAWIAEGAGRYGEHYARISGGDTAYLGYASSVDSKDPGPDAGGGVASEVAGTERAQAAATAGAGPDAGSAEASIRGWADRFRRALSATHDRERRRGMTVVGPHRDDVRFHIEAEEGPRDLRGYGSSGQQRTAALALRLLEADRLRERLGREPVYLLDDVFAELDEGRSERLLELFETGREGQVILTAPKPGDVTLRGGGLTRWRIRDGQLLA